MESYTYLDDVLSESAQLPSGSILSRTLIQNEDLRVILFQFARGEELSEHTSSKPAVLHFLAGEARVTLGSDEKKASPNTFIYMQPNLSHSIVAETEVTMLLVMMEKE